jgi:hypothetical protein
MTELLTDILTALIISSHLCWLIGPWRKRGRPRDLLTTPVLMDGAMLLMYFVGSNTSDLLANSPTRASTKLLFLLGIGALYVGYHFTAFYRGTPHFETSGDTAKGATVLKPNTTVSYLWFAFALYMLLCVISIVDDVTYSGLSYHMPITLSVLV